MGGISGSQSALMPARAGVARAGGYRAGYFSQTAGGVWSVNIVALINGVDVSAYIRKRDQPMAISQVVNDQPDTATFTLKTTVPFMPRAGHLVTIALGDAANVEFSGQVLRARRRYVRGITSPFVDVECIDYSRLFDRRVVTQHWSNASASQIAIDIVELWTSGFTHAGVAANLPTIDDFSATNETGTSLMRRLANLIDGAFRFNGRDVHLFGVAGDQSATAGTNPLTLTISPVLKSFKGDLFTYEEDVSQIRTRSIVEGKSTTCPVSTPSGSTSVVIDSAVSVDYLIVAGGGAGGAGVTGGGGGGGGGVLAGADVISASTLSVVVGAGGATVGADGTNSSFNGHSATGGGGGGGSVSGHLNGDAGGSGGGGNGTGTAGAASQGNAGGNGDQTLSAAGGGGGGAGAPGGAAGPNAGGAGGAGLSSSISGALAYYSGGGGGNSSGTSGAGGTGGGGKGGAGGNPSAAGTANSGGGGGGSQDNSAANQAGGSGIVILSYPVGALSATGGTITTVSGRTIHTFTTNGTFTVSTVTLTAPAPVVTDIPLDDASQIDANPGFVRIGTQVFPYLTTAGPVLAPGANPPGSSLSVDVAIFATSLGLVDSSQFTSAPGWAKVGDQIVRFASVSGGALQGVPALGFGSLAAAVKAGTSVTWLGSLVLSATGVTFSPPLAAGDEVIQRVVADDLAAQATVAALEGGDGVHEQPVSDGRLSVTGATNRAHAELADFSAPITPIAWDTEDMNARPGRRQAVAISDITVTLVITKSDISFPTPNGLPRRQCEASTVHMAALLDAVVTNTN